MNQFPGTNYHDLNLDWILEQVKNCLAEWETTKGEWESAEAEINAKIEYINNYFANLDVNEEISEKINAMIQSGELLTLIAPQVAVTARAATGEWLDEQVVTAGESIVVIDRNLSIEGAAADAQACGAVKSKVELIADATIALSDSQIDASATTDSRAVRFFNGQWETITNNAAFHTMEFNVIGGQQYRVVDASKYSPYIPALVYYDANNNIIGSTDVPTDTTYQATRVDISVVVPVNCTKIVTNNFGNPPYAYESSVYGQHYDNKYKDIIESIVAERRSPNALTLSGTETGAISLLNGSFVLRNTGTFASWQVQKFSVEVGKKYHVRGVYYPNTPVAAFVNNNAVVDVIGNKQNTTIWSVKIWEYDVVVPNGVSEIWINKYGTSDDQTALLFPYENKPLSPYHNKKWTVIGDSLTEYNYTSSKKYFDYAQEQMGLQIENLGIGGTGYKNQGSSQTAFYERISQIPSDTDIITIFGSGNDLSYTLGTVTDSGTDTICGCINKTIDDLYTTFPTAKLGIISPCPWVSFPTNTDNAMSRYSAALKQICEARGIPFLDLYRCSGFRPWDDAFKNLVYTLSNNDGVHPNNKGHEMLASHITQFIKTLMI